jgi:hypothetical protein
LGGIHAVAGGAGMTEQQFDARMVSPKCLIETATRFVIPLYQRLYVWKQEQVQRLMDDIIAAWLQSKENQGEAPELYYLGGILAIHRGEEGKAAELELIDGQQRLTTLWLLALAWSDDSCVGELKRFVRVGDEPRIRFAIRQGAERFVETALGGEPEGCSETLAMEEALQLLSDYPHKSTEHDLDKSDRKDLSDFILNKVRLALTLVPAGTDLNKLFEVINNRGEQLQHHDILKMRLLEPIKNLSDREAYARIWDACAAMDDYVERNFAQAQGDSIKATVGDMDHDPGKPLSLDKILNELPPGGDPSHGDAVYQEDEGASVESIISFPMLLQHTLRLYRHDKKTEDIDHINDKALLNIFGQYFLPPSEEEAKAFIEKLWNVRVACDDYVVKWVDRGEGDKELHVRKARGSEGSYSRSVDGVPRGLSLLQSVIYHSQGKTTQYWLTPFLAFCLEAPEWDEAVVYLEYLDNALFLHPGQGNRRERSLELLKGMGADAISYEVPSDLERPDGTDFRHYWFYKNEYVLWKDENIRKRLPADWRLVARNSVEHVYPQNDLSGKNRVGKWLNRFANLALVSREENSRLSNRSFEDKKARFGATNPHTRSLKLDILFDDHFFNNEAMNDPELRMEAHQNALEALWRRYQNNLRSEVDKRTKNKEDWGKYVTGR